MRFIIDCLGLWCSVIMVLFGAFTLWVSFDIVYVLFCFLITGLIGQWYGGFSFISIWTWFWSDSLHMGILFFVNQFRFQDDALL